MKSLDTQLLDATNELISVRQDQLSIYTNGKGLLARVEAARAGFFSRLLTDCGEGTPLNIARGWPAIESLLSQPSASTFIMAKNIADEVASSPEFIEAFSIIDPLVSKVRSIESEIKAEFIAAGQATAARNAAIEKATSAALAKIEKDFAVA